MAGLPRGEREAKTRGIAVRAEYAAFMGECERLGVSVGGNAENKYMVFRRTLVRDDAALRGGDGLGGEGGMVDLRYGADVALVCADGSGVLPRECSAVGVCEHVAVGYSYVSGTGRTV